MDYKGILIAIGGNEDKGSDENRSYLSDYGTDGILSRVVKESGGESAKIIVIPTASSIPVEVGENYISAFEKLGCKDITVLDIRTREDAAATINIDHFIAADCIMFSGGDQSKIVDIIGQTKLHRILVDRYKNEPVVIAGTSAGAMAMSSEMIYGGSSTEALFKSSVLMREGMSLIPKLIIDTHFIKRGRFGRVAEAVAKHPSLIGVGLAEDTGMIIKNGNELQVIGSSMIILFDPSELTHNNEKILSKNTPMTIAGLKVHILAKGDRYLIDKQLVQALPLEADFNLD